MTPVLELRDLKVERGGAEVLDIPSFRLHESEVVALIGPNGCGKTTLLLSMMSLLDRAAGRLLYRGEEVQSNGAAGACCRQMAMIFQEPILFDATVYENVASGLKIRGLGRREMHRRAMS